MNVITNACSEASLLKRTSSAAPFNHTLAYCDGRNVQMHTILVDLAELTVLYHYIVEPAADAVSMNVSGVTGPNLQNVPAVVSLYVAVVDLSCPN